MSRATILTATLALLATSCGGRLASDGESGDTRTATEDSEDESASGSAASSGEASDEAETDEGTSETGEVTDCELGVLETFDIEALVGEETVVQEIEALDSGEVLVAGYYGLARGGAGGFELIDAPPVLASSFLQLRRGEGAQIWATAFGDLAYTADAGDTWETWTLQHDALVHRLEGDAGTNITLGADALIGRFDSVADQWWSVDPLDGDTQNLDESNMIMALVEREGQLIAAERFGRMATAPSLEGPWAAIEGPLMYEPELLDLGELGVFLWSGGDGVLFHSDDGLTWTLRGSADSSPDSYSTQLGFRASDQVLFAAGGDGLQASCDLGASWVTLVPDTESTVIYDISVSIDGEVWAAGFNHAYRLP